MPRHYYYIPCRAILLLLLLAGASTQLFAQRFVYVPRGHGTLNQMLSADSINRVNNPNTVYLLERGDFSGRPPDSNYVLTSTITAWGSMPLYIASYGTGPLPKILPGLLPNATSVSPPFRATNDLYLTGVYLTARDVINAPNTRVVVTATNGIRIVLDSCQVNGATQSTIRALNDSIHVYLQNCIISNMNGDFGNGRVVDNRGIYIDTLVMRNCAIYRTIRRVYREGGGTLGNGFFEHNTFDEIGLDILNLGNVGSLTIQNNIFADCGYIGNVTLIGASTGIVSAIVRNNCFWADTVRQHLSWPDSITIPRLFDDTVSHFISQNGDSATNIFSPMTFTMAPNSLPRNALGRPVTTDSIAKWYWEDPIGHAGAITNLPQVDSIHLVNFAYNSTSQAWNLGNDGRPVGCLLYFPPGITGVDDGLQGVLPEDFELAQNYPNPFNPSTTVTYSLPSATNVTLKVYDLLGQEVGVLVDGLQSAGLHRVKLDATSLSSGVYFYVLQTPGKTFVRKMMVMK